MGKLPRTGRVEAVVSASPEKVWGVLTDIGRTGEWSHETRGGEWLGSATGPQPGARFRGLNGKRMARWSRTCEVEEASRPARFSWRTVPTRLYPDSTRWVVELTPVDGGTRVVQSFEILHLHPLADRLFYALIPAHRDRLDALEQDLRRLGEVAAAEPVGTRGAHRQ